MSRRVLWSVIVLSSVLPAAAQTTPTEGPPGRPKTPGSPAERLHRHLEQLDQEVGRHWHRVQVAAERDELPTEATARCRITGDTEGLRRRLDLWNVKVEALSEEEGRALRSKVRSIGRVLGNLERVAAGESPPSRPEVASGASLDSSEVRRSQGAQTVRSLSAAVTAANSCADAPLITGGTFTGTTLGATNDGTASCGSSDFSPDVWFRWMAPSSGTISLDTFGSGFDTVLSVVTACPPSGFERACNDDASGLQSAVSLFASAGTTYWIRISGFNGAAGPFELHLGANGAISGTVTRTSDGSTVDTGTVEARSSRGFFLRQGTLQEDGTYTIPALTAAGDVKVRTATDEDLLDEIWDDHPCEGPTRCDLSAGDDVTVNSVDTTPEIDFALDVGGAIAGKVVHDATGDPVEGVELQVWKSSDFIPLATAVTGADGTYRVERLASGSYRVLARSSDFANQLYDGISCPDFCEISDGTPVTVSLGATTPGIDFRLERLGIFEGTVTETATGDPVDGAVVDVRSPFGFTVSAGLTDASGSYRIGGVAPGTYVLTARASGLITEIYEETTCHFFCDERTGTPLEVGIDQVVSGIDFTLERPGSISGAFSAAGTGEPVVAEATLFDAEGRFVGSTFLLEESYRFEGLAAGQYFVRATGLSEFLDELYDDVPCHPDCSFESGTPVTVVADTETTGIDFTLDRGGTITGRLTDAQTGVPLSGRVSVHSESGSFVTSDNADGNGIYEAVGLLPGDYVVQSAAGGYSGQLYDAVPCFRGLFTGCLPEDGNAVTVDIDVTAAGIDFAMVPLARLSGRLFVASTGQGISFGQVLVFDSSGERIEDALSDFDGFWTARVPAGRYFLRSSTFGLADEIYDGHECFPGCDVTVGTPVVAEAGEERSGLDFALEEAGSITGTVVDALTGEPIGSAHMELFEAQGRISGFTFTDSAGRYEFTNLLTATYFVRAEEFGFLAELYEDLVCTGSCDPFKGHPTPVQVVVGAETSHIDFELEPFTSGLVGTVLDASTGLPVVGVGVQIWDSTGVPFRRVITRRGGVWLASLDPGTYFIGTDTEGAYVDQVHPGVECGDGCNPSSGTPVTVDDSSVVREIDFLLQPGPAIFSDGFESGDLSLWMRVVP